jgi:hypothetical protein|tara:strand:+ start:23 stop:418 length:396 start_codon:yes stop_codon:yes gene_type:complete
MKELLKFDNQVYGFVMLLYSQQLFTQMFNAEVDAEFEKIRPVVKQLYNALRPEITEINHGRAMRYKGRGDLTFSGVNDLTYIIYCISNYRVPFITMQRDDLDQHEEILYNVLYNVCVKSHKIHRQFNQRFV